MEGVYKQSEFVFVVLPLLVLARFGFETADGKSYDLDWDVREKSVVCMRQPVVY